jgi:hypothetical protein
MTLNLSLDVLDAFQALPAERKPEAMAFVRKLASDRPSKKGARKAATIHDLCRAWRQRSHREAYETSLLDEWDEDGVARVCNDVDREQRKIVEQILSQEIATVSEAEELLGLAVTLITQEAEEEQAISLVRHARKGLWPFREAEKKAAKSPKVQSTRAAA